LDGGVFCALTFGGLLANGDAPVRCLRKTSNRLCVMARCRQAWSEVAAVPVVVVAVVPAAVVVVRVASWRACLGERCCSGRDADQYQKKKE